MLNYTRPKNCCITMMTWQFIMLSLFAFPFSILYQSHISLSHNTSTNKPFSYSFNWETIGSDIAKFKIEMPGKTRWFLARRNSHRLPDCRKREREREGEYCARFGKRDEFFRMIVKNLRNRLFITHGKLLRPCWRWGNAVCEIILFVFFENKDGIFVAAGLFLDDRYNC